MPIWNHLSSIPLHLNLFIDLWAAPFFHANQVVVDRNATPSRPRPLFAVLWLLYRYRENVMTPYPLSTKTFDFP